MIASIAGYIERAPEIIKKDLETNRAQLKNSEAGYLLTEEEGKCRLVFTKEEKSFVAFDPFYQQSYTMGWSLTDLCPILIHRHNISDSALPLDLLEKVKGVAKKLFSFQSGPEALSRYDVMALPKYFANPLGQPFVGSISSDFSPFVKAAVLRGLITLLKTLSEKGCVLGHDPKFIFDRNDRCYYLLETSVEIGEVKKNDEFLKETFKMFFPEIKEEVSFEVIENLYESERNKLLHHPYTEEELKELGSEERKLINGKNGALFTGGEISKGKYKKVFKGSFECEGVKTAVAVSVMNTRLLEEVDRASVERIFKEEEDCVLKLQGVPCVVQALCFLRNEGVLEIVTPLYQGDLQTCCNHQLLSFVQKVDACYQGALGLKGYQQTGRIYCDVKPENFLIRFSNDKLEAVLTDFGGGVPIRSPGTGTCTPLYCSPEMFAAKLSLLTQLTLKHDSWGMIAIALNVLFDKTIAEDKMENFFFNIPKGIRYFEPALEDWKDKATLAADELPPFSLKKLFQEGLRLKPETRPSMAKIAAGFKGFLDEMAN